MVTEAYIRRVVKLLDEYHHPRTTRTRREELHQVLLRTHGIEMEDMGRTSG